MKFTICFSVIMNGILMLNLSVYENKWLNIICGSLIILDGLIITFFVREDCMFKNIKVIKEEKGHDTEKF